MFKLFDNFASWYDFHTPPGHYAHDHELVLSLASQSGGGVRLLDIGCGTGVLVEKARAAGFDAYGFDVSADMIKVARNRLRDDSVWVQRMQDMSARHSYDIVVSLSWCIHYCLDAEEVGATLDNIYRSLVSGGRVLLQVAHAPNIISHWCEDRESGPTGLADDVKLRFMFEHDISRTNTLLAHYHFDCSSTSESFREIHYLNVADATVIAELMSRAGFQGIEIWNSWRRDPFADGASVFITGVR